MMCGLVTFSGAFEGTKTRAMHVFYREALSPNIYVLSSTVLRNMFYISCHLGQGRVRLI